MATAPNTSFIPKRGPVKRARQTASRQVHLFTIFSYILFCATLLATVAVFFYNRYIDEMRRQEIAALDVAISSFNETEMNRVLAFDSRLRQADQRLQHSVSVASIFDALELATVQSARLARLAVVREGDSNFMLEAEIEAESFDSSLFQRGIFERNEIIESVEVNELGIAGKDNALAEEGERAAVKFTARLLVPLSAVPFEPAQSAATMPVFEVQDASSTATSSGEVSAIIGDNQNTL